MDINFKGEKKYKKYVKCLEKYDEDDLIILDRHIGSQLGTNVKFNVKNWLLSTESNRGHQSVILKKMSIIMAPIEDMPLELDYPHPLIKAIIYWRLEVGK